MASCLPAVEFAASPLENLGRILVQEAVRMRNDVQRPILCLVIDSAQVFADDAEEDELDAAQEEHADQRRGLAQKEAAARIGA